MRTIVRSENLEALRSLPEASVQLVYMDPPFNTGRTFGVHVSGRRIQPAFRDAGWGADELDEVLTREARALITALGQPYVAMMAVRLAHARRVLSDEGSLFLHCDPTASHYLKLVCDAIFGAERFRNEIVWRRTHAHGSARRFAPVHDTILFYSRGRSFTWTEPRLPYSPAYVEKFFRHEDERGRYQLITCTGPGDRAGTRAHYEWRGVWPPAGRHWAWTVEEMERLDAAGLLVHSPTGVPRRKHYPAGGVALGDLWDDIPRLDSHSRERVGFETQKPVALLERIIGAASEPGATILDPFGGSGTTALAAEGLGRGWMLVDASLAACSLALGRVRERWPDVPVRLEGFPASVGSALDLRARDPDTYGLWGTSMLGTLHDRAASDRSLATGRTSTLRSWVPLTADARFEPGPHDRVLGRSGVPLAACVSEAARAHGLAA